MSYQLGRAASDTWYKVPVPDTDAVFKLDARCKKDPHPNRVNLVIGAYRDDNGKPMVLDVVREAERRIFDLKMNKEYLSMDGMQEFVDASVQLLLGPETETVMRFMAAVQSLSGTGAIRTAAEFYRQQLPSNTPILLSDPTWANHPTIFRAVGFTTVVKYRYFDPKTKGVDFKGMMMDLKAAPRGSIIVLHLCAHNPTGADPTPEQWKLIADVCVLRNFRVLFDCAYQGYATGDLDRDAFACRMFAQRKIEFAAAQSYSKNLGLYAERIGCLMFYCGSERSRIAVFNALKNIIRATYSNPPCNGARIAHMVLTSPDLREKWKIELEGMAKRIVSMRAMLCEKLKELGTPGTWNHITDQIGMFSYLGLSTAQSRAMVDKHHVYILGSGRASIAGLSTATVPLVAKAIDDVVRTVDAPSGSVPATSGEAKL